jgi:hypothetical protein
MSRRIALARSERRRRAILPTCAQIAHRGRQGRARRQCRDDRKKRRARMLVPPPIRPRVSPFSEAREPS